MKKILLIICLFLIPINIQANEKIKVNLDKCVDGDTAWFIVNNEKIKTRFLAIDTPESTNKIEKYGKEASKFTCDYLKKASKIEIEYDTNSTKTDKYDRHLVWVFVDNELLQDLIVKEGLADIKYIYGDYKYLELLNNSLEYAKRNELNIWNNNGYLFIMFGYKITTELLITILGFLLLILGFLFNKKFRNKIKRKTKNKVKKKIDELF